MNISIDDRLSRVQILHVRPDLSGLTPKERAALEECIKAANCMSYLYLKQVSPDNYDLYAKLQQNYGSSPYRYFMIQGGPWDTFNNDVAFISGVGVRPKGANFYPTDLTIEEWDAHLKTHPEDKKEFTKPTTVIRRNNGTLTAIPYSEVYAEELAQARTHLLNAAALLDNGPLKRFLVARAEAFVTNDYRESDLLWIKLDGTPFDVTIGPYEEYHDQLLGLKATFEAFVSVPDPQSTENMKKFLPLVGAYDCVLTVDYGHSIGGSHTPLQVVRDVYRGGEAAFRRQFVAHNLPNDADIRKNHGYRQVFSATMMQAKFDGPGASIGRRILSPEDWDGINFSDRLLAVTGHELSHGIGPKFVICDGHETGEDHMDALKELALPIEEAKADTLGMCLLSYYCENGVITREELHRAMISCIPVFFMGFRKGFLEAHACGDLIEYNWLVANNALQYDPRRGIFDIDVEHAITSFADLSDAFIRLQIAGDYAAAKAFVEQWTTVPPEIPEIIERLSDLPIEIMPHYELSHAQYLSATP